MTGQLNFYDLLGLNRRAAAEDIRRAYHAAARSMHPDVNPAPEATDEFLKIQTAYEVLSDTESRRAYDASLPEEVEEEKSKVCPVLLGSRFSRSQLPAITEAQLIYALLNISAAPAEKSPAPLNIALLIDRSTSMRGERMDMVKSAAIELARSLKPDDVLSVITFSDRAEVLLSADRKLDRRSVETALRMIQPKGGTEMLPALQAALHQIHRFRSNQRVNHILMLTDGRTYGDESECLELAAQAASLDIGISGLGIGEDWNDAFLDELSNRTGGESVYIAQSSDIRPTLLDKLNELQQVFAEGVILNLHSHPSSELRAVFRLQPNPSPLLTVENLRLGPLHYEPSLLILLEYLVQPLSDDFSSITLAQGSLNLNTISTPPHSYALPINFTFPIIQDTEQEKPSQAMLEAVSQLTLYRLQERARQEAEAGQSLQASRRLHHLAAHLVEQGKRPLAQTVLIEANHLQREMPLTKQGKKSIKYGTRALLLPGAVEDGE